MGSDQLHGLVLFSMPEALTGALGHAKEHEYRKGLSVLAQGSSKSTGLELIATMVRMKRICLQICHGLRKGPENSPEHRAGDEC